MPACYMGVGVCPELKPPGRVVTIIVTHLIWVGIFLISAGPSSMCS